MQIGPGKHPVFNGIGMPRIENGPPEPSGCDTSGVLAPYRLNRIRIVSMDLDAMRLLQEIPDDLKMQGWEWVRLESRTVKRLSTTWYKAVYARPFERGIDPDDSAHHHKGSWWVRVSTNQLRSASWHEAHAQAIALMREADA
jgi:hypothetical protein